MRNLPKYIRKTDIDKACEIFGTLSVSIIFGSIIYLFGLYLLKYLYVIPNEVYLLFSYWVVIIFGMSLFFISKFNTDEYLTLEEAIKRDYSKEYIKENGWNE